MVADVSGEPTVDPYETGSYNAHARWRTLPAEDAATDRAHKVVRIPNAPGPFPEPLRAALRGAAGLDEPGAGSFLGAILLTLGLAHTEAGTLMASSEMRDELLALDAVHLRIALPGAWLDLPYGLWDELTAIRLRGEEIKAYRTAQNWHFSPEQLTASL